MGFGCGKGCGGNGEILLVLAILFLCCGNNGGLFDAFNGCGKKDDDCTWVLLLIVILFCCCGNGGGLLGCGDSE